MDNTTAEADNRNNQTVQAVKCPCCGQKTLKSPPDKLPQAVVDSYMASIMTGVPFSHIYVLYDGKVKINCSILKPSIAQQLRAFSSKVYKLHIKPQAQNKDPQDLSMQMRIANILYWLGFMASIKQVEVRRQGFEYTTIKVQDNIIRLLQDFTASTLGLNDLLDQLEAKLADAQIVSGLPKAVLDKVSSTHLEVYKLLIDAGFDANFWSGIQLS